MIKIEGNHKEECARNGIPPDIITRIFSPWDESECPPEDYMPVHIVEHVDELNSSPELPNMSILENPGLDFCDLVGDYWIFGVCISNDGGPTFILKKEMVTPSIQWHFDHWDDWCKPVR